jgi:hypothetical protein
LEFARELYANGKEVPRNTNMFTAFKITQEYIKERVVIYNASFLSTEFFSRTDILVPSKEDDSWEIIEVKSSINIKPDNIKDLSFQLHVAKLCGLNISNCSILNVNPKYVFDEKLDLNQFFVKVSLLERMKNNRDEFLRLLDYSKSLIHNKEIWYDHNALTLERLKDLWLGAPGRETIFPAKRERHMRRKMKPGQFLLGEMEAMDSDHPSKEHLWVLKRRVRRTHWKNRTNIRHGEACGFDPHRSIGARQGEFFHIGEKPISTNELMMIADQFELDYDNVNGDQHKGI